MQTIETIDTIDLETVTGGAGEGWMGAVRAGLVGASLLTGNPEIKAPRVEPIRIEMPIGKPPVTQR